MICGAQRIVIMHEMPINRLFYKLARIKIDILKLILVPRPSRAWERGYLKLHFNTGFCYPTNLHAGIAIDYSYLHGVQRLANPMHSTDLHELM